VFDLKLNPLVGTSIILPFSLTIISQSDPVAGNGTVYDLEKANYIMAFIIDVSVMLYGGSKPAAFVTVRSKDVHLLPL